MESVNQDPLLHPHRPPVLPDGGDGRMKSASCITRMTLTTRQQRGTVNRSVLDWSRSHQRKRRIL
jgi:hypothetical protein